MVPHGIVGLARQIAPEVTSRIVQDASNGTSGQCAPSDIVVELANVDITLLGKGGYNDVWLVTPRIAAEAHNSTLWPAGRFVLRVPNEESLKPYQVRNEAGWLKYMAKHCPDIPVPAVLAYSDGSDADEPPFIALEYVDATALSDAWTSYTEPQKEQMALTLATLVVRPGEIRFDAIGGMTPDGVLGATVEGSKLFKGRNKFHNSTCYDIGPYSSIKQNILAYYDKEIYYHTHAEDSMLDEDLFETMSARDFAEELKKERASVEKHLEVAVKKKPFVLRHNGLQGRNILVRGTSIVAVIDWEFAGSYPLSELEDGGVEVLEMVDETSAEECFRWCGRISELVREVAVERGWRDEDVQLLTSGGDPILQGARVEMIPAQE